MTTAQTLTDRETACLARVIEIGDAVDFGGRHASKADRKAVEHLIEMGLLSGTYRSASATKATPKKIEGPAETTDKVADVKPARKSKAKTVKPDKPKDKPTTKPAPETQAPIGIVKGVPLPKLKPANTVTRYPFAQLDVNDAFFLPDKTTTRFASYCSLQGRTLGRKFRTRTVWMHQVEGVWQQCEHDVTDAVQGVGVWRIE